MRISLDNSQRRFWLHNVDRLQDQDVICNLDSIPDVYDKMQNHCACKIVIKELWNNSWKRISKKHLNEMFAAHEIDYKLK